VRQGLQHHIDHAYNHHLLRRGALGLGDLDGRAADDGERGGEGPEGEDEAPGCGWMCVGVIRGNALWIGG
jgi:hypothetical protein